MNRLLIALSTILFSFFTLSCSDDEEPNINPLAIGDFHQGGVVFYLNNSSQHGLIVAMSDQSFEAEWGCPPVIVDGANGLAIGTGQQNTIDILNSCSNAGIAADLCNKLESNGYSDWYLPSKDELNELFEQLEKVNDGITGNGGSSLENTEYWSSSHQNSNTIWVQSFNAGSQSGVAEDSKNNVRAIRSF